MEVPTKFRDSYAVVLSAVPMVGIGDVGALKRIMGDVMSKGQEGFGN